MPRTVHELVRQVAEKGLEAFAVGSALTAGGPGLGSRLAEALEKPSVAVITGHVFFPNAAGEVWYLLDERAGMPVSLLDADRVLHADVRRYTTVLGPGTDRPPRGQPGRGTWCR